MTERRVQNKGRNGGGAGLVLQSPRGVRKKKGDQINRIEKVSKNSRLYREWNFGKRGNEEKQKKRGWKRGRNLHDFSFLWVSSFPTRQERTKTEQKQRNSKLRNGTRTYVV